MKLRFLSTTIVMLPLAVPLIFYVGGQSQRPLSQDTVSQLFHGVDYQRRVKVEPRPHIIHQVTIDLLADGVQPFVTLPPTRGNLGDASIVDGAAQVSSKTAMFAQTTGEFMAVFDLNLAVNANYFYEFEEKTPWQFYPHQDDPVYTIGEAIAPALSNLEGPAIRYGLPRDNWPALCFLPDTTSWLRTPRVFEGVPRFARDTLKHSWGFANRISYDNLSSDNLLPDNQATIEPSGTCPDGTRYAIAGRDLLVDAGHALTQFPNQRGDKPYARTSVGLDAEGQTLWIVIVDGKQPDYSEGMLLSELAVWFEQLGAARAIALDGGGSSTLVIDNGSGPSLLNAPIQAKWPMNQRPIANHLGFYALPIAP